MFRGANPVNLDNKGRLAIPGKYREQLQTLCNSRLIVTIDNKQPCLLLYPLPEWEVIEHKLSTLSTMDASHRRLQRLLLGHATECELDSAGRLLLPSLLREHGKLQKQVMLVGQCKKFELWDSQCWMEQIRLDIDAEARGESALSTKLLDLTF